MNMKIYEATRYVPPEAKKPIPAGRLKGYTNINPMWRIKTMTEQFGICGIGWRVEITDNVAFVEWAKSYDPSLLHIKAEPNKTAIKNALNGGMEIPLAQIVERKSMQVK